MNLLFAVVAFGGLAATAGVVPPPDARLGSVYEEYLPEGTWELARLPHGALVESVEGRPVGDWSELTAALRTAAPGPVTLEMEGVGPVTVEIPSGSDGRDSLLSSLSPVLGLPPEVNEVRDGTPAEAAGLRPGDRILRVAGLEVEHWSHLVRELETRPGEPVPLAVLRSGDTVELSITPEERVRAAAGDTLRFGRIGVTAAQATLATAVSGDRDRMGPGAAVAYGLGRTGELLYLTVDFLGELITGARGGDELGGPILIGQVSGQMARAGLAPLLQFMAFISVQIGLLNLLPVPVLDGGHLVFLGIEAVRGRPVEAEHRARWTQAGMLLLAALMVWVIFQDIFRIVG
jgi:regulator of sigma E protease